jgi:hypothetical protein
MYQQEYSQGVDPCNPIDMMSKLMILKNNICRQVIGQYAGYLISMLHVLP